jgi:uncharacterized membrane protein YfcA
MGSEAAALLLAVLIGVSLGALGSGGSIVTLPILVYVAGVAPKSAVGMSMSIVGATSLIGCILHWRRGNFLLRTAVLFCVTGIPGAYLGSLATHLVSSQVLLLLFSGLMLVVGSLMLAGKRPVVEAPSAPTSVARCLATGFVVGLVTGFLGVGGGFLIVPSLIWFAGVDTRRAIGTSLGIIAVNTASGLVGQLRYAHWDWLVAGQFFLCSLLGMAFGISICTKVPARTLSKAFACAVLAVAFGIGWQVLRRG